MDITEEPVEPDEVSRRWVVVGVDGSKASSTALGWAAEEARMRKAALRVIHVWQVPAVAYGDFYAPPIDTGDWRPSVVASLDEQVRSVLGDHPGLEVICQVEEGQAAQVLVEQASGADLLVVGSRGHGGFVGLLLGSVSSHLAHHATCPVTIVRDGA